MTTNGVGGVGMGLKQYIYTLKLIPNLLEEGNWTERENQVVKDHFENLQRLLKRGTLILAGKTDGIDKETFGIVILQTETEEEAQELMQNDPTVREGIMTAELFPYSVALFNNQFQVEE
jgi:uncharacterized protein